VLELALDTKVLTAAEVAEYLRVSTKTVYAMVQQDAIPHRKVGRRIIFLADEVDRWLRARD